MLNCTKIVVVGTGGFASVRYVPAQGYAELRCSENPYHVYDGSWILLTKPS